MSPFGAAGAASAVGAAGAAELEESAFTSLSLGAGNGVATLKRISAYCPYHSWNCCLVKAIPSLAIRRSSLIEAAL